MISGHCKLIIKLATLELILLAFLSGCVGLLDWSVYLPENYAIIHVNSSEIIFGKLHEDGHGASFIEPIGDSFVVAYCYNDEMIGLCCADDYEHASSWSSTGRKYYLYEFKSGKAIRFYDQYELETVLQDAMDDNPIVWKLTRPTPEEAIYPDEEKEK